MQSSPVHPTDVTSRPTDKLVLLLHYSLQSIQYTQHHTPMQSSPVHSTPVRSRQCVQADRQCTPTIALQSAVYSIHCENRMGQITTTTGPRPQERRGTMAYNNTPMHSSHPVQSTHSTHVNAFVLAVHDVGERPADVPAHVVVLEMPQQHRKHRQCRCDRLHSGRRFSSGAVGQSPHCVAQPAEHVPTRLVLVCGDGIGGRQEEAGTVEGVVWVKASEGAKRLQDGFGVGFGFGFGFGIGIGFGFGIGFGSGFGFRFGLGLGFGSCAALRDYRRFEEAGG